MPSVEEITQRLDRIDWNFPGAGNIAGTVHTLHRFPGNFIPQIPSYLVQAITEPGDTILDPFVGSGTSIIESIKLDRNAIGADRVTASLFVADAKISALRYPLERHLKSDLLAELTWDQLCETNEVGQNGEGSNTELEKWYSPETLRQLRFIWKKVEKTPLPSRKTLLLIFSDVLFSCASTLGSLTKTGKVRRHHWGWIADNVHPKELLPHNAIKAFRVKLERLPDSFCPPLSSELVSALVHQDARNMALPDGSVDFIVTSPPYISVIDYVRANRILYLWMGWNLDIEKELEIGARHKRRRKNNKIEYYQSMHECWKEMHRVLRPRSYCALVIGESRAFTGTVEKIVKDFKTFMPLVWGPKARIPSRRRVSDTKAREAVESICVFQKT